MPKRNWNDINDSDSSLSSEEQVQPAPIVTKRVSAPPAINSKLKSACDQKSLNKMDQHEGSEVWLHILNSFYDHCEQANTILDSRIQLKKVIRVKNVGWNVLTAKQIGRNLIQDGFTEGNLSFKFIYSNLNDKTVDDRTPKTQKKVTYVEKNTPQMSHETQEYNVPQNTKNQGKQGGKKVKWVQKSKSMKDQDSKTNLSSYQQLKSCPKQQKSNSNQQKSPKKFEEDRLTKKNDQVVEAKSPKRFKLKEKTKKSEQSEIKAENIQQKIETSLLQQTSIIKQQPQITKQVESAITNAQQNDHLDKTDEVSSNESLQKQQNNKKKRKPKKPKQTKSQKIDDNPFSYFKK